MSICLQKRKLMKGLSDRYRARKGKRSALDVFDGYKIRSCLVNFVLFLDRDPELESSVQMKEKKIEILDIQVYL